MKLELISEFKAHPRHAQAVLFTHDGRELATTGMDALVQVWSLPDFANSRSFQGHEKSANAIALSPDGAIAVTGSTDRAVMVWDWKSGEPLQTLTGHRNTVAAVAFSPNGDLVATSAYGGMVGLWQSGSDALDIFRSHPRHVTSLSFSPDGSSLAAAGLGNVVKIWDAGAREMVTEIETPGQAATSCLFLPDGRLCCTTYEGEVVLYSADSYEPMASGFPAGRKDVLRDPPARLQQPLLLRRRRSSRTRPRCYGDFGQLPDRHQGNVRRGVLPGRRDGRGGKRRWPLPRLGGHPDSPLPK